MTYTRKAPREPKMVTFNLSWIVEDITIICASEIPYLAVMKSLSGDYKDILDLLPNDFVDVLETADDKEFQEFVQTWTKVSAKELNDEKKMDNLFSDIMSREDFNFDR